MNEKEFSEKQLADIFFIACLLGMAFQCFANMLTMSFFPSIIPQFISPVGQFCAGITPLIMAWYIWRTG